MASDTEIICARLDVQFENLTTGQADLKSDIGTVFDKVDEMDKRVRKLEIGQAVNTVKFVAMVGAISTAVGVAVRFILKG